MVLKDSSGAQLDHCLPVMALTDSSVTQTIVYLCCVIGIFMRYTIRPLFTCYGIDIHEVHN